MKCHHLIAVVLFVAVAISAIATASAMAEEGTPAKWLANGTVVTSALTAQLEGELIVEDTKSGDGMACSLILDGTVNASGYGEITALLSLAGIEVTLAAPVLCKSHKGCEENATDIELAPEGLPWSTDLEVTETGKFLNAVTGLKVWTSCLVFGFKASDECTAESLYEVLNMIGGVEAFGALSPMANCTTGGSATGLIEFVSGDLGLLVGGETLAASGEFIESDYEGEGAEKGIPEGSSEEETKNPHVFEFINGMVRKSVECQAGYSWPGQPEGNTFEMTPSFVSCTYNGVNIALSVGGTCLFRLRRPYYVAFARQWFSNLDLIGTGCQIAMTPEAGCQVTIASSASNQNLAAANVANLTGPVRLRFAPSVEMTYTSTGCTSPILANGRLRFAGLAELPDIRILV